jgi:hypothetical protein
VSNLLYLLLAVVLSIVGSLVLWARNRQPRSIESGIEQFSRELRALAPEHDDDEGRGQERRTG